MAEGIRVAIDVFLSVGRTSTAQQEAFVKEIEAVLRERDLRPRNLGRIEYSSVQPLRAVEEVMDECHGAVIVAFERLFVERGAKRRGSSEQETVESRALPTVWNQIEAAMAYVKRQPLLVIVEQNLMSEGLLETGYDWYVQWLPVDPSALRTAEALGRLDDWRQRVVRHAAAGGMTAPTSQRDISHMSVGELVGMLKPAQLWAVVSLAAGILGGAFVLGSRMQ